MKYSELDKESRKHTKDFLILQARNQSESGQNVLEQTMKAVLLANTGGIAVSSSLVAANTSVINICYLKTSTVLFVLGVISTLIFQYWLALKIGTSVKRVKEFHNALLDDEEDASQEAVNVKMAHMSKNLDGDRPMRALGVSIFIFLFGAVVACLALYV